MKCPVCGHPVHKVVDSRSAGGDNTIRRRRECRRCGNRWTTWERDEEADLETALRIVTASVKRVL